MPAQEIIVSKIDRDKLVITQANKLVEASYTMSLEEKRIVLLMVSLVRQDDKDFKTYRLPITDIRDYLGLNTNKLYADIKRVADALMARVLHIPEDDGGWLKVGWVASARYVPKGRRGAEVACLDLCFSPEIKPYLLELKAHFTNYMLQNVAGLRSFYSIRFYELLKSRHRLKKTTFAVAELRKILKAENKYRNYKDFRARVIRPAQIELAEKTDLAFDVVETRKGRKVIAVLFRIRDNVPSKAPRLLEGAKTEPLAAPRANNRQPPLIPPTDADKDHQRRIAAAIAEGVQNGVREAVMRDLLATRNPHHVMENIELARARLMEAAHKQSVNLAALTVAAITHDYAAEERAARQDAAARAAAREWAKAEAAQVDAAKAAVDAIRRREITARLAALPAGELEALRAEFRAETEAGAHGSIIAAAFRAKGWKAAGIGSMFRLFAAQRLGVNSEDAPLHAG